MIEGGYILQPRVIQESDISVSPPYVREIWSYLLREANSQDNKYGGHQIKRGQLFRSYNEIREGTKWYIGWRKMMYNENHVKKAMKFLRDTRRITTQKEPGGVLITICKYEYYQNPKNYEKTTERTDDRTIVEPLPNQSGTTYNKNHKNDKKEKEERKRAAPVSLEVREKDFKVEVAKFTDKYPKETLRAFFNHWSQPNQPKTKMRWEMEKTWDTGKRLANWKKNEDTNFGRNNTTYSQNGDSIEIEPGIEYYDKSVYKYPWHKNKKTQMWIKGHPYAATNQAEPQYADGMGRFITKEQFELLTKKEKL